MKENNNTSFFTPASDYALKDRGGVRYQWQTTPVKWGDAYSNIYAALYGHGTEDAPAKDFPFHVLQQLLNYSDMQLIGLLNEPSDSKRHIVTRLEPEFRKYEKKKIPDDEPFFVYEDLFEDAYCHTDQYEVACRLRGAECQYSVNILDFEKWAVDNADELPENRYKAPHDDPAALHATIGKLEEENARLLQEIAELRKKISQKEAEGEKSTNIKEWVAERKKYYSGFGRFSETVNMILDRESISKISRNMQAQTELLKDGLSRESIARFFNGGQQIKSKGSLNGDAQRLFDGEKDKP